MVVILCDLYHRDVGNAGDASSVVFVKNGKIGVVKIRWTFRRGYDF